MIKVIIMKQIKILVIGISDIYGGVEKSVLGIINNCKDIDFEFLCFGQESSFRNNMLAGMKIYYIPNRKDNIYLSNKIQKQFWKRNGFKYDYVWINTGSASNISSHVYAKKYTNAKVITHSHSSKIECENALLEVVHTMRHFLNRNRMNKLTDIRLACSELAAKHLFGSSRDVTILKNAICIHDYQFDPYERKQIRRLYDIDNDEIVLIMVGRLENVKNPCFALQILNKLSQMGIPAVLIYVGDGSLLTSIKKQAEKAGITQKIIFAGFQTNVNKYMSSADCLLLPSYFEGFPMTLIEAQANSLPCVVSDTVTKEAKLSDLVEYASIHKVDDWINNIMHFHHYKRNNNSVPSLQSFDIKTVCDRFKNILEESQ